MGFHVFIVIGKARCCVTQPVAQLLGRKGKDVRDLCLLWLGVDPIRSWFSPLVGVADFSWVRDPLWYWKKKENWEGEARRPDPRFYGSGVGRDGILRRGISNLLIPLILRDPSAVVGVGVWGYTGLKYNVFKGTVRTLTLIYRPLSVLTLIQSTSLSGNPLCIMLELVLEQALNRKTCWTTWMSLVLREPPHHEWVIFAFKLYPVLTNIEILTSENDKPCRGDIRLNDLIKWQNITTEKSYKQQINTVKMLCTQSGRFCQKNFSQLYSILQSKSNIFDNREVVSGSWNKSFTFKCWNPNLTKVGGGFENLI